MLGLIRLSCENLIKTIHYACFGFVVCNLQEFAKKLLTTLKLWRCLVLLAQVVLRVFDRTLKRSNKYEQHSKSSG